MTMETEPEATASSMIVDMNTRTSSNPQVTTPQEISAPRLPEMAQSSGAIHDNTSIELPAVYVPFSQDSSVRHASRHLPIRVESTSSHASRQPSGSLVSDVTHASQGLYIGNIDNISSKPPPTFANQYEREKQPQKANMKRRKKTMVPSLR